MRPTKIVRLLKALEAVRNPEFFQQALTACTADDMGKLRESYAPAAFLNYLANQLRKIDYRELGRGQDPQRLPELIERHQAQVIKRATSAWSSSRSDPERARQGK